IENLKDISKRKENEEKLTVSERRYKETIELAPLGIYRCKEEGTIIAADETFTEMFGYEDTEDILQLNLERDIYANPSDRAELIKNYFDIGYVGDKQVQWKKQNGKTFWVQITAKAVKYKEGNLLYFEGF